MSWYRSIGAVWEYQATLHTWCLTLESCSGGFKRGTRDTPPPPSVQILSFSCSLWQKFCQTMGWRSSSGFHTPYLGYPGSAIIMPKFLLVLSKGKVVTNLLYSLSGNEDQRAFSLSTSRTAHAPFWSRFTESDRVLTSFFPVLYLESHFLSEIWLKN